MVKSWTPVVPLLGETEPVRFAVGLLTVTLTAKALFVTEPFWPRSRILP